ncbi:MAG: TPM domain-containing protein [Candidatus Azobacteroides sp.]|nr:TPM domain-containing protein [Candidatus Azobacteroides sp.]
MLTKNEQSQIVAAIQKAEKTTSGEIRVHISNHCKENVLDAAANTFKQLKLHETTLRNGTLIYVVMKEKKLAILGDAGINALVSEDFWEDTLDLMRGYFRQGKLVEGICKGIEQVGVLLKQYFPARPDDINELPDEVSFD